MELPQSRPFGTEGKKPTHDFLSLYNHSSFQHQDPRPSQGIFLKTRDFLQPLETVGKSNSKGESIVETTSPIEKPVVSQRPPSSSSSSSIEHILPGGIGTYTISHISNFNHQLVPKPEITSTTTTSCTVVPASSLEKKIDVNKTTISNSTSSYSGSSFSLWGESVVEKATTKKAGNNHNGERHSIREPPVENLGQWSSEQPLQATTNPYIFRSSFSSLPSSKAMSKSRSFMEMMKSGKSLQEEDDDDEEFLGKKDASSQKELTVKVDGKGNDQKANTPRSKHSATEQRRRSKINDRFQILRDLIPLNDQKRDKASFLLEVIEYIQFLQEKVNKYEGPYQGWNQEPTKLMPWRNRPGESIADHSQAIQNGSGPGLMFAGKFNDHNVSITPPMLANAHNPVENDRGIGAAYKPKYQNLGVVNKAISLPGPMQANMFIAAARSGDPAQPLQRPTCDAESPISKSETHLWQNRPSATASGALNEQDEMAIEGGTISISNVYSQGLLNNLTKALQSSGVDLSQASISVQIDLGKQPISRRITTKDHENPSSSNQTLARLRDASSGDDSVHQAQKRLKTEKS